MTTEPSIVEIVVDGRTIHRFAAARVTSHENAEQLTLEASRWVPEGILTWPNPALPDHRPTWVRESERTAARLRLALGDDPEIPADQLPEPAPGPNLALPDVCTTCRHQLGPNGGHARTCPELLAAQLESTKDTL